MPGSDLFQLSRCHQLLMGKCLDGLQQPVAGSGGGVLGLNQRLVNQGGEQPGYLAVPYRRAGAHLLRGTQRPSSGEDSKPTEQCLLRLAEQLMAPVNRGPERLMPGGRADGAAQQREPVIEAVGDLPDAERGYPRGGQLQRQWDAIQAEADGTQRGDVSRSDHQARPGGAGPLGKQGHRPEPLHLVERRAGARARGT